MAFEEGIVTSISDDGTAQVRVARSKACEGCASQGSCQNVGSDMEVAAINRIAAGSGDRVVLAMGTGALIKATLLLYVVPIAAMIIGAAVGQWLGPVLGMAPTGISAGLAFAALGVAVWIVRGLANRMAQRDDYRPRIHRVIERAVHPVG